MQAQELGHRRVHIRARRSRWQTPARYQFRDETLRHLQGVGELPRRPLQLLEAATHELSDLDGALERDGSGHAGTPLEDSRRNGPPVHHRRRTRGRTNPKYRLADPQMVGRDDSEAIFRSRTAVPTSVITAKLNH